MQNFADFINDLSKLISIKSDLSAPSINAPFGDGVKNALDTFLSIAKNMGFATINYDGYMGEVVFGEGEEIGIIGHVDVVPAGTGWNSDPFKLTKKDGVYYGRGLLDNKAPMLLCLYALNELKNSKIKCNKKFRLIVGCDEESGWRDVKYFNSVSTFPEYGFSPDGNFPVSYAEKGMAEIEFNFPKPKNFYSFSGGTVVNAVCALASVNRNDLSLVADTNLDTYNLTVNGDQITSVGISAHGSSPHLGKNAILPLLQYLLTVEYSKPLQDAVDYLFLDKWGLSSLKNEQGVVTLSPNLIRDDGNNVYITCDCRYPYPLTIDDLVPYFDKSRLDYKIKERHRTQFVQKDGFLVKALLSAYDDVLKVKGEPISQSGSTFARAFSKGCAFGPEFVGEKSSIHEANENVSEENLIKLYRIYKKAIFNLASQK